MPKKRIQRKNQIIACQDDDNPRLMQTELSANRLCWVAGIAPTETKLTAKIRYRQDFQTCALKMEGDTAYVTFDEPQRAVTPGQSIVFYNEAMTVCLGGGEIK